MAEHPGFLRDIIEHPDDDAPRLIYADWLEENGQPERAELIRVQDELAHHHPDYAPRSLQDREASLLVRRRLAILRPFLDLGLEPCTDQYAYGADRGFTFHFRRGFVEALEVWCADAARLFVERAEEVFSLTPLRHVRFRATPDPDLYVYGPPPFDPLDLPTLRRFLALPQIRRLRSIDVSDNGLRNDEVRLILGCPHFAADVRLYLGNNPFGPAMHAPLTERFGRAGHNPLIGWDQWLRDF
jgi:uncharacterized protein (TIGR02996 family)